MAFCARHHRSNQSASHKLTNQQRKNTAMPLTVHYEPNDDIWVLHMSGTVKRPEFAAGQAEVARKIDTGARPRLLSIFQNSRVGNAAQIGMISIFCSHTATRSRRSLSWVNRGGGQMPSCLLAQDAPRSHEIFSGRPGIPGAGMADRATRKAVRIIPVRRPRFAQERTSSALGSEVVESTVGSGGACGSISGIHAKTSLSWRARG